jgi:hypothetical protein
VLDMSEVRPRVTVRDDHTIIAAHVLTEPVAARLVTRIFLVQGNCPRIVLTFLWSRWTFTPQTPLCHDETTGRLPLSHHDGVCTAEDSETLGSAVVRRHAQTRGAAVHKEKLATGRMAIKKTK